MKKSKCPKCKGTGNVKKKHFTVLNWPIATFGLFFGSSGTRIRVTEKRPGWIKEVTTCPECNGTGEVS